MKHKDKCIALADIIGLKVKCMGDKVVVDFLCRPDMEGDDVYYVEFNPYGEHQTALAQWACICTQYMMEVATYVNDCNLCRFEHGLDDLVMTRELFLDALLRMKGIME